MAWQSVAFGLFRVLCVQLCVGEEEIKTILAVLYQNLSEGNVAEPGVYS